MSKGCGIEHPCTLNPASGDNRNLYHFMSADTEKPAFDSVRRRAFCISVFLQVSAYMISSLSDLLRQVTGDHRLHTVLTVILHGLIVVPACESQHIQHPDHMVDLGLNARSLPFKERFLLGIGSCALCTPVHEIEKNRTMHPGFFGMWFSCLGIIRQIQAFVLRNEDKFTCPCF